MADIEFDEITDEQGQELPQKIELSPDAIINQLMRRYSGQLQQQTWENTLLATENEQLKTMWTEAKAEAAEAEATIVELVGQLESVEERLKALESALEDAQSKYHWEVPGKNATMTEQLSSTDDPQPEDGFLAMASGQPGLQSSEAASS